MARITFRLPDGLHERVLQMAEAEQRSLNQMLVRLVAEAVQQHQPPPALFGESGFRGPDPKVRR